VAVDIVISACFSGGEARELSLHAFGFLLSGTVDFQGFDLRDNFGNDDVQVKLAGWTAQLDVSVAVKGSWGRTAATV
jgi:hypothetical protein